MFPNSAPLSALRDNLAAGATQPLPDAARSLFRQLGYNTSLQLDLPAPTYASFNQEFEAETRGFSPVKARVSEWAAVHLLFQITAAEMQATGQLFEATVNREDPDTYLFFAVELTGASYTKPQLAAIVRELNKPFPMHVFVLFRYGGCLTLSLIQRRPNRRFMDQDVLETVTHVHGIHAAQPHSAHVRILNMFSWDAIRAEAPGRRVQTFRDLHAGWRKVMRTDVLNQHFYRDYQHLSKKLIRQLAKQVPNKLDAHQGVLNLLNRVMFVYFVQKKGWLMGEENFLHRFWLDYQQHRRALPAAEAATLSFHEHWLNPVFFAAFNNKLWTPEGIQGLTHIAEPYKSALPTFPYLNGGLFAQHDTYDQFLLPDEAFAGIFDYFESYLFTIQEDTPFDVTLEINPELLGKMYEGMINATDLDDVDAEHGIVYTERPEINFMVRRSFVEVLDQKLNPNLPADRPHTAPRTYDRTFLYHFIFDKPEQKAELLRRQQQLSPGFDAEALRTAIATLTACDPSCGSGSMLLGVITVQMELLRTLDTYLGRPHSGTDDYDIKKQLISECLYGVDIKEWAVRIAELRLWLYMITEAEFTTDELRRAPLLPNLDFKLRQGNSLLQKFGTLDFTVADLLRARRGNTSAKRQLREFIRAKKAFVTGSDPDSRTTAKNLKQQEQAVFVAFLQELIEANEKRVQQLGVQVRTQQGALFNTGQGQQAPLPLNQAEILALKADTTQLRQLLTQLRLQGRLPFSYDIDFMELFVAPDDEADRGFDLVIGNPPYVRQEDILPPEDGQLLERLLRPENATQKKLANKALKDELNAKVYKTYPFLAAQRLLPVLDDAGQPVLDRRGTPKRKSVPIYGDKVPGRADLYIYFQLLAPSYLNRRGTFCFIISNSWLDVEFGAYVQQFLLKHTRLLAIYDCHVRSFDAAVNTIIYLHSAPLNTSNTLLDSHRGVDAATGVALDFRTLSAPAHTTQFVHNKVDYTLAAYAPLLREQEAITTNSFRDYYRLIPFGQPALLQAAAEATTGQHEGDKWGGKYLRAPEIYYTILQRGAAYLTRLGNLADVRYGIKTGANDFFILDAEAQAHWQIEERFLRPILKNSREARTLAITPAHLQNRLFVCSEPRTNLRGTRAGRYIAYGEDAAAWDGTPPATRPSCASRALWYNVGERVIAPINCNYMVDSLMRFIGGEVIVSDNFQEVHYDGPHPREMLFSLNSTLFALFLNIVGRANFGDGLMKLQTFEVAGLMAFNPAAFTIPASHAAHFNSFTSRPLEHLVTELGFDRTLPIRAQQPAPLPDRAALDTLIFDALGLSPAERQEVYWAVAELVQQRLRKAASR